MLTIPQRPRNSDRFRESLLRWYGQVHRRVRRDVPAAARVAGLQAADGLGGLTAIAICGRHWHQLMALRTAVGGDGRTSSYPPGNRAKSDPSQG